MLLVFRREMRGLASGGVRRWVRRLRSILEWLLKAGNGLDMGWGEQRGNGTGLTPLLGEETLEGK